MGGVCRVAGAPSSEDSDVACLPVSVALALRSRDWPARCRLLVRSFESAEGRSGPPASSPRWRRQPPAGR